MLRLRTKIGLFIVALLALLFVVAAVSSPPAWQNSCSGLFRSWPDNGLLYVRCLDPPWTSICRAALTLDPELALDGSTFQVVTCPER